MTTGSPAGMKPMMRKRRNSNQTDELRALIAPDQIFYSEDDEQQYVNFEKGKIPQFNGSHAKDDERGFLVFKNCQIDLSLTLEIWNVDDRIIMDKDHRKRAQSSYVIFEKRVTVQEPMTTFGHMHQIRNKYFDHAQILQNMQKVHFSYKLKKIASYDMISKQLTLKSIQSKETSANKIKLAFRDVLHYKDLGKRTQFIE